MSVFRDYARYHELLYQGKETRAVREFDEGRHMRCLFTPELKEFLRGAGLRLAATGEWMTPRKPGTDAFGVYSMRRKTG